MTSPSNGGTSTQVAKAVEPKLFRSSTPNFRQPSATSVEDDDCHIAKHRLSVLGALPGSASIASSMRPQVAAMAVKFVISWRLMASRSDSGRGKDSINTRVAACCRVKLVL